MWAHSFNGVSDVLQDNLSAHDSHAYSEGMLKRGVTLLKVLRGLERESNPQP